MNEVRFDFKLDYYNRDNVVVDHKNSELKGGSCNAFLKKYFISMLANQVRETDQEFRFVPSRLEEVDFSKVTQVMSEWCRNRMEIEVDDGVAKKEFSIENASGTLHIHQMKPAKFVSFFRSGCSQYAANFFVEQLRAEATKNPDFKRYAQMSFDNLFHECQGKNVRVKITDELEGIML